MKIEIIDKKGNFITDFELESNPFKVGEIINIVVNNYDKDFWTAKKVNEDYKIDKIEHFLRKDYQRNNKVYISFCISIKVVKLI